MTFTDEYRAECDDCGYRDDLRVPARHWSDAVKEATTRHAARNFHECSGEHLRVIIVERDVPRCEFCGHDTSADDEPHCCDAMRVKSSEPAA